MVAREVVGEQMHCESRVLCGVREATLQDLGQKQCSRAVTMRGPAPAAI